VLSRLNIESLSLARTDSSYLNVVHDNSAFALNVPFESGVPHYLDLAFGLDYFLLNDSSRHSEIVLVGPST
jgi:hypothetical protein